MDKKEKALVYTYLVEIILLDYVEDRLEYGLSDYISSYPSISREGCSLLKSLIEEYSRMDFSGEGEYFTVLEWLEEKGFGVEAIAI
jgi:hypothetical protein